MKRTPLWHDPDDDEVSVSLVDASRKRKLRKDYDEKEVSGKVRKYYSITKCGRKILNEKQEEWNTYSQAVTNVLSIGGAV